MSFIYLPIVLYICLLVLSNNQAFIPIEFQQNQYRLLLVVAHPDDECLFFSPTLRVLQKQYHVNLSLVVFSRGNHVGLGETRAMELHGSCRVLNIPKERCISLDLPNIQDNPKVWWSEQQLIPIINEYINQWSINALVSFDKQGVSGHLNHRAVASAVRLLTQNKNNTMIKMSYELKSVSILRKYSSLLDFYLIFISSIPRLLHSLLSYLIPFNLMSPPNKSYMLLINTPNDYMISRSAFASHQSQFSWDRYIYLIASRYMFINELKYIDKQVQ
jgi:N-acetylglucosaminylphosphatidylinositol deacetylase